MNKLETEMIVKQLESPHNNLGEIKSGLITAVITMLKHRMTLHYIMQITGLTEKEIIKIKIENRI
jgi:hypothetical protein